MNTSAFTWGLTGLLLVSVAGNVLLWQRTKSLQVHSAQMGALQAQMQELQEKASEVDRLRVDYEELQKLRRDTLELARLRNEAAKARATAPEMEKLQAQLAQLTQQLNDARQALSKQQADMQAQVSATAQSAAQAAQAERANSIKCVNNLKQVSLGLRIWANDQNSILPPNFMALGEAQVLQTPAVLVCPSDAARQPIEDWALFSPAAISYQYLLPNANVLQLNPQEPMTTCPIHGHIGQADGAVIQKEAPAAQP